MRRLFLAVGLALASFAALAQTASPNLNDQQLLSSDTTFQARARESFIGFCVSTVLPASLTSTPFQREREHFCSQVLASPDSYKIILAELAATNALVVGDATVSGTVSLATATSTANQAALVTDVHLNNALSAAFNILLTIP